MCDGIRQPQLLPEASDNKGAKQFTLAIWLWPMPLLVNSALPKSNKQVIRLSRMIGNRAHEEKALMNLGSVFCKEGKLRVAVKCFRRSLNLARQLGNRQAELASLTNLGSTYAMLGETNRAIELLRLALFLYLKNGDRLNESRVLCNLGSVYADSNDPQLAIDLYR